MPLPLAVVAGVGPGVGAAIARRFANEGFRVATVSRSAANLEQLAAPMREAGGDVVTYGADLSDHADTKAVFGTIIAEHGPVSALIWNAAVWSECEATAVDPADLDRQFRLGLSCALTAIHQVFPGMQANGKGTILLTGGGLALAPQYGGAVPALTAVKSALRGFVHASAPDFAARGIRLATVTIAGQVAPGGPFDPDLIANAFWDLHAAPDATVERVFDGAAPTK